MLKPLLQFLIGHLVFALVLVAGLQTSMQDLRASARERGLLTRTLLVANIAVPLLTLLAMKLLSLQPRTEALFLLMAICPGAPLLLLQFRSRMALPSIVLLVVSLGAMVTTPLWVAIVGRVFPFDFDTSALAVLVVLAKTVLLPMAIGLTVRQFLPQLAPPLAKLANLFFKVAVGVAIVLVLVKGAPVLLEARPAAIVALVVLTIVAALMGHWAGGPTPEGRAVVANVAALGNPMLAIAIAAHSIPGFKVPAMLLAYVLVRALALIPIRVWEKRRMRPPHPPAPLARPAT